MSDMPLLLEVELELHSWSRLPGAGLGGGYSMRRIVQMTAGLPVAMSIGHARPETPFRYAANVGFTARPGFGKRRACTLIFTRC
jgi:hypothetical protein